MVDFSGWRMPIQYPDGIIAEHLATRKHAGLFDVSHMGRFQLSGPGAAAFLRYTLTNDCECLPVRHAHYTMLANEKGGAIDDAFLYRLRQNKYLLVVNASNRDRNWKHLQDLLTPFKDLQLEDVSNDVAMLALQGPESEGIMQSLVTEGALPESKRNTIGLCKLSGVDVMVARTGYTGEPVCFELFIPAASAELIWDQLIAEGATPVGLGARDTLRLEVGLPLYGHELGIGRDGNEIPIYAVPQARFAVSFRDKSRDFIGRAALEKQAAAKQRYKGGDFLDTSALPKIVRQFRLLDKGIAREGADVYFEDRLVGWVSSGTMVPYWVLGDRHGQRAIGLCLIESQVTIGSKIEIEVRGRKLKATVVTGNLQNRKTNRTYAVLQSQETRV